MAVTANTTIDRRPKDSMKSTWRTDRSQWGPIHWLIQIVNLWHEELNTEPTVHQKTDKVAYMTEWSTHRWIWVHSLWVMALQHFYTWYTGHTLSPMMAFTLYTVGMQLNSIHQIWVLRRMGHKYGFYDGDKHKRDGVPDQAVMKTFLSLILTTTIRPALMVLLAYDKTATYPTVTWWFPIELGAYSIVLDGYFYLYHRSCHEYDSLWRYHRTHHLTKHPSPMLSSYADSEQEFLELALIPVLSWATLKFVFGLPMGFNAWWICHEYIIFSEAFGHSGVRVFSYNPGALTWLLKMLKCELMIEDHDLHHRKGWRKSHNYGKQTRFWDRIFGTCGDRIEAIDANCDYENQFNMPVL